MDSVRASELPPDLVRPLPLGRRVLLISEILAIYCRVRVRLHRERLPSALAGIRELPAVGGRGRATTPNGRGGATTAKGRGRTTTAPAPESAVTYLRAARLARAVRRTLRLVPADARCLMQSLVLTTLLARRGIDTKLLIGVNPGDEFEAHAWVEYAGHALPPDSQGIYHVLTEL